MNTSQHISDFLSFCRDVSNNYKFNYDYVNEKDKETDDILHQIELGHYKDRSRFATKLAHVRQERRIAKDFVDVNKELVEYLSTPEFIKVHKQLEQILGRCRKQERYVENQRSYRAKVREDLTINQIGDKTNE